MIIKKRKDVSIELIKCESLVRRISLEHEQFDNINQRIAIVKAGEYGEQSLDYYLTQIPDKKIYMFQDLRLPTLNDSYFQIDVLLLTPQAMIIIESKHIKGTVKIDEYQMIRKLNDQIDSFTNPVTQVWNQHHHLKTLLENHSYQIPPIYPLVVFTNPTSMIEVDPNYTKGKRYMVRSVALRPTIMTLIEKSQTEVFSVREMNKLTRLLCKLHTPRDVDIIEKYGIKTADLIKGIYCNTCETYSIEKNHTWKCKKCNRVDHHAFLEALLDYYYFFGENITTRECMAFLGINSRHIAYKILKEYAEFVCRKKRVGVFKLKIDYIKEQIKNKS